MRTLRNIFRKKLRSILTILGISIGVFVLVVMGSLAEKITILVEGGTKYFEDKVIVSEANFIFGGAPMVTDRIAQLEKIEGVELASGTVSLTLDDDIGAVNFGPPPLIDASDLKGAKIDQETFNFSYAKGRALTSDDIGKAVVGSDLVAKLNAEVGENIKVRGKEFEVIGILEKTLTVPDTTVSIPLTDAKKIYWETLPEVVKEKTNPSTLLNGITVYAKQGVDANDLAKDIELEYEELSANGPQAFEDIITSSTDIFTFLIFGVAIISLLVGGLSVTNTMTMSISERYREIGVRKAIGASNSDIVKQFMLEAAFISIIGGVIGLFLGWIFIVIINIIQADASAELFLLTDRLAIGALAFALLLGLISGFFPAWRASRMNPVEALRYE